MTDIIRQIADRAELRLREAFLKAAARVRNEVDLEALARAIATNDADAVAALITALEEALSDEDSLGGAAGMALVISAKAASAALPFSFSPDTARAKFADHRASLIRSVSVKSAQATSATAARASGNRPRETNVTRPASQGGANIGNR